MFFFILCKARSSSSTERGLGTRKVGKWFEPVAPRPPMWPAIVALRPPAGPQRVPVYPDQTSVPSPRTDSSPNKRNRHRGGWDDNDGI